MPQKTDGNNDDVVRVVRNLKNGMPWHLAKGHEAFMAIEDTWYERNKSLLEEWSRTGIPLPKDSISGVGARPLPIETLATPDGKVWAIYKDSMGRLTREEIQLSAPSAPVPVAVLDEGKTMTPGPNPDELKKSNKKW